MALSEHEERMLKELERALYEDDPRFATTIRDAWHKGLHTARTGVFAVLVVVGIIAIVAGVAIPMSIVGIAGFVLVLGGLYGIITAMTNARKSGSEVPGRGKAKKSRKSGSYLDRAEERFRNRNEGRDI